MASLSALLEKEASAEIEAILSEARARASEIVANAETEAEGVVQQQERRAKAQYEAALIRAKSSAQLEASSLRLNKQHEAVERVMAAVKEKLAALSRDASRYQGVLAGLLDEAVAGLGGRDKVQAVLVNPADVALAEKLVQDRGLNAQVSGDERVKAGVRLRAASNVSVENSLFGRLEALRDELASDISRTLFGKDEA